MAETPLQASAVCGVMPMRDDAREVGGGFLLAISSCA